jgi:ATP-dependent DNA helicase HFM1/MER3
VQELPQYSLEIQQLQIRSSGGNKPIEVDLSVRCGLVDRHDNSKAKKLKRREINMTVVYAVTSDLDFIAFQRTSYVRAFRFSALPLKVLSVRRH